MVSAQIERLQKDSEELEAYIHQLHTQGKTDRVTNFVRKKAYLDNRIAEIVGTC